MTDNIEVKTDIVVPPVEDKVEEVELTDTELQASDKGWKPLDAWVESGGDPKDHRSAKEFLDRGELLDRIKDQSRELKQLGGIVGQLSEQNKGVYRAGYVKALQDLNAAKANAIKESDGDAVVKIEQAIDQTKFAINKIDSQPAATQQQVGETEAFVEFKNNNSWFNTDSKMKRFAYGAGMEYANANPQASEKQVYQHVEKLVREEFPEKFQRKGPPSPDGESRRGTVKGSGDAASRSFEKVLASMPEDQARVARDMVRRGIVTKEKYAQDYEAIVSGR